MTKEQYLNFHKEACDKLVKITEAKNADYAGHGDNDPFANFRLVEKMGITDVVTGFLTRMSDKISCITTFKQKGQLQVKDESVEDTLLDLANDAILLAGFIESEKPKGKGTIHEVEIPDDEEIRKFYKKWEKENKKKQKEADQAKQRISYHFNDGYGNIKVPKEIPFLKELIGEVETLIKEYEQLQVDKDELEKHLEGFLKQWEDEHPKQNPDLYIRGIHAGIEDTIIAVKKYLTQIPKR